MKAYVAVSAACLMLCARALRGQEQPALTESVTVSALRGQERSVLTHSTTAAPLRGHSRSVLAPVANASALRVQERAVLAEFAIEGQLRTRRPATSHATFMLPEMNAVGPMEFSQDTTRRRVVSYSEWYGRRLTVHRYGSYVMLPLFVTQYTLGTKLIHQKEAQYAGTRLAPIDRRLRSTHAVVAGGVGALFFVNTTTGIWNLVESRKTTDGRKLRTVHALTMLAADAGFAYTGVLGSRATGRGISQARMHRNTALTSFGIATAGASLMWFGR